MESGSEHPIARALLAANEAPLPALGDVVNTPGQGISARLQDTVWRLGRPEFVSSRAPIIPADWPAAATCIALGHDDEIIALFAIGRPASAQATVMRFGHPHPTVLARYRKLGLQIYDSAEQGAIRLQLGRFEPPWSLRQERRFWRDPPPLNP